MPIECGRSNTRRLQAWPTGDQQLLLCVLWNTRSRTTLLNESQIVEEVEIGVPGPSCHDKPKPHEEVLEDETPR